MKKRMSFIILTLALFLGVSFPALAETGSVTILGGTLSETIADVTLSSITLDGTDQTAASASGSNFWTAVDSTGTGSGWNLTILGTDFVDGTPNTIDIDATDQRFQMQLLDADIAIVAGNTKPVSSVTTPTNIPTVTALKFLSAAADTGMGSYTMAPSFSLMVPAETYVGTGTYNSTITVTIVSGP